MPPAVAAPPPRPRERRHELDALRVLAVVALLLYHASRPFDTEVWHVKDVERSRGLELFGTLLTPWRLPLLFMISGLGTYYALGFRPAWRYAAERILRLLLPLAFGMAVVVVPQVYVEYIWHQTVLVIVAHFVLGWAASPLVKFAAIGAISLVVTVALCEGVALTPITRRACSG